ncbi:metallophosphoesterase [Catellatospora sp. KI3]|uniref:metallophosphoesterase family protein n=1 Tax=Catellatospora sp. KI3 TaxID=3041620 RepID=UPI0024827DCA|nr:metallophosphoesterase [Catellatospora sp. KI3]MDI1465943.1 metallophosphoesterase [Catellatospora sp. KI3]
MVPWSARLVARIAPIACAVLAAGVFVVTAGSEPAPPVPVLVGAGDIGSCTSSGDRITADLLDDIPGTVFTLGDNAYMSGSRSQFRQCYGPYWGRHRDRTRPVVGNHDLLTDGGAPYYDYFGASAGPRGEGWYSYRAGDWLVLALNSSCDAVDCSADGPQARWLHRVLQQEQSRCTVAMWHHPVFTSGGMHQPERRLLPVFRELYDHGVDVLLTAHNHNYERFAPQNPDGVRDDAAGVREFVVGTGGASLYRFPAEAAANSEARDDRTFGVLKLTLRPGAYDWEFVGQPGGAFSDTGSGRCH